AFARMGIEAGNAEPWRSNAEPRSQLGGGDTRLANDKIAGKRLRHSMERNMDGDRDRAQARRAQHHDRRGSGSSLARQGAEIGGVAFIGEAGAVEGFLLDRVGDDGGGVALERIFYRLINES